MSSICQRFAQALYLSSLATEVSPRGLSGAGGRKRRQRRGPIPSALPFRGAAFAPCCRRSALFGRAATAGAAGTRPRAATERGVPVPIPSALPSGHANAKSGQPLWLAALSRFAAGPQGAPRGRAAGRGRRGAQSPRMRFHSGLGGGPSRACRQASSSCTQSIESVRTTACASASSGRSRAMGSRSRSVPLAPPA